MMPLLRPGTGIVASQHGCVAAELVLGLPGHSHPISDHHDHSHVAIEAVALTLPGCLQREVLEPALLELIREHGVLRLKGRLWQPGKARPLELQAVGPRLESWYAATAAGCSQPPEPLLELVALGFNLPSAALRERLEALITQP